MKESVNMEEFTKFAEKFNLNDPMIKLKYNHSMRVQKLCEQIARSENENIKLASIIGLLHDYGRFYQWQDYHTYNDLVSIDHGDYGVQKLFEENEIKSFYQEEKIYKIIYEAIKYHNKYSVPKEVESKIMCDIVRDADKLDILYLYKIGELKIKELGSVSEKVKDSFYKHNLINNKDIKSEIDITIRTLGLIYKLNFLYSYKYLDKNNIIKEIFNKLKDKEKLKPYFDEIEKYIKEKLEVKTC